MDSKDIKQYSLQSLIDDLNYATLIGDRWSIEFIDSNGVRRIMGNGHARIKDGIWVTHLDKDKGEFPRIRAELEIAKHIITLSIRGQIQVEIASAK